MSVDYVDIPEIEPGSTSYFSSPSDTLDPHLFQGNELKEWVRTGVLTLLFDYLARNYTNPNKWTKAWLAGSGVSYQWQAAREPGDLDCLVGIDYVTFRANNQEYAGLSNSEVASMFNEGFNKDLMPNTRNWEGYELTFYVNQQSNITDINPYAAYDLVSDTWTVVPEKNPQPPYVRSWEQRAQRDHDTAVNLIKRYSDAVNEIKSATNPAYRVNAEHKIRHAREQAVAFYDDIHRGRKIAFSPVGAGYNDYNNYRWQAGKRSGAIQALRKIKEQSDILNKQSQVETYGVELPNTDTLIRRSLNG